MSAMLKKFVTDERGTETVEWAIMAGLFTSVVILAVSQIATWVGTQFTTMETNLGA